jgi:hypothetical protein
MVDVGIDFLFFFNDLLPFALNPVPWNSKRLAVMERPGRQMNAPAEIAYLGDRDLWAEISQRNLSDTPARRICFPHFPFLFWSLSSTVLSCVCVGAESKGPAHPQIMAKIPDTVTRPCNRRRNPMARNATPILRTWTDGCRNYYFSGAWKTARRSSS